MLRGTARHGDVRVDARPRKITTNCAASGVGCRTTGSTAIALTVDAANARRAGVVLRTGSRRLLRAAGSGVAVEAGCAVRAGAATRQASHASAVAGEVVGAGDGGDGAEPGGAARPGRQHASSAARNPASVARRIDAGSARRLAIGGVARRVRRCGALGVAAIATAKDAAKTRCARGVGGAGARCLLGNAAGSRGIARETNRAVVGNSAPRVTARGVFAGKPGGAGHRHTRRAGS